MSDERQDGYRGFGCGAGFEWIWWIIIIIAIIFLICPIFFGGVII